MSSKRLFIALTIPDQLRQTLEACKLTLTLPGLSWVKGKNLHVTVLFLGSTAEDDIAGIKEKLHELTTWEPFKLQCTQLKPVSKRGQLTMLWAEFAHSPEFVRFSNQIANLLNHSPDHDPLPHVTLARVRKGYKVKLQESQLPVLASHTWIVNSFGLWESTLSPQGAEYSSLHEWELRG